MLPRRIRLGRRFFNFKFIIICLAIPGKIKKINKKTSIALVDFDGIEKSVNISLVKAKKGGYVIVHAGFAIQKLGKQDAYEVLALLNKDAESKK